VLWQLLVRYWDVAADVLPRRILTDMLRRSRMDTARSVLFEELYAELERQAVSDAVFRYSVNELREVRADQLWAEALNEGMERLTRGLPEGEESEEEVRPGFDISAAHVVAEYGRILTMSTRESAPEGDMGLEMKESLVEYANAKRALEAGTGTGILTGIGSFDRVTSGLQPGELTLICAYTGAGKSMLAAQTAWHAAVKQRKNVFYATSETTRGTTRRRVIARHSREPQFGIPGGLNSKDIKDGKLTPDESQKYMEVWGDWDSKRKSGEYGRLHISQVPRGATIAQIESRLQHQQAQWKIDLVVIDYLALLRPDRKRREATQEFQDLLKEAKVMATTFDDGRGIPVLSPWSMQQGAYKEALKQRRYTLASLSDTSEAEKSPDILYTLLRMEDEPGVLYSQFLKNRDGETPDDFRLEADYRSTYIGEPKSQSNVDTFLTERITA
jgi:hypothetical protein